MSRSPDEDKRRRILQVSFEAFGEQGYKKTTIKQIADRAGIAPGSIYTYFHDKDSLFLSAITEIWDRFSQAAQTANFGLPRLAAMPLCALPDRLST